MASDKVTRAERIELIRRLLVMGTPEWQIRRTLTTGAKLDDGRVCKVTSSTVTKDLKEVGLQYRALHDSPLVAERVVGACAERLVRIADKAEVSGKYHAAIRANMALVELVSRTSTRWARGVEPEAEEPAESAGGERNPREDMTTEELQAEIVAQRGRLKVIRGGK